MHVQVLANDDDGSNDASDLVEERSSLVEQSSHDPPRHIHQHILQTILTKLDLSLIMQGWIFWPTQSEKKKHRLFLADSYFINKKFVKSKSLKNKLALKSDMNGSLLCELFDLTNFLLIKQESPKKSRVSFSDRIGQNIHPCTQCLCQSGRSWEDPGKILVALVQRNTPNILRFD